MMNPTTAASASVPSSEEREPCFTVSLASLAPSCALRTVAWPRPRLRARQAQPRASRAAAAAARQASVAVRRQPRETGSTQAEAAHRRSSRARSVASIGPRARYATRSARRWRRRSPRGCPRRQRSRHAPCNGRGGALRPFAQSTCRSMSAWTAPNSDANISRALATSSRSRRRPAPRRQSFRADCAVPFLPARPRRSSPARSRSDTRSEPAPVAELAAPPIDFATSSPAWDAKRAT